jgi:hypothetical protein
MSKWQPKQINPTHFLISVEVCGDGDEANGGSEERGNRREFKILQVQGRR